jgi:hypothetical protein
MIAKDIKTSIHTNNLMKSRLSLVLTMILFSLMLVSAEGGLI